jgi:hypothetical protein
MRCDIKGGPIVSGDYTTESYMMSDSVHPLTQFWRKKSASKGNNGEIFEKGEIVGKGIDAALKQRLARITQSTE